MRTCWRDNESSRGPTGIGDLEHGVDVQVVRAREGPQQLVRLRGDCSLVDSEQQRVQVVRAIGQTDRGHLRASGKALRKDARPTGRGPQTDMCQGEALQQFRAGGGHHPQVTGLGQALVPADQRARVGGQGPGELAPGGPRRLLECVDQNQICLGQHTRNLPTRLPDYTVATLRNLTAGLTVRSPQPLTVRTSRLVTGRGGEHMSGGSLPWSSQVCIRGG
jgi:hypothetical protein